MTAEESSLSTLRHEIDGIDDAILDLLARRAEIAAAIATLKKAAGGEPAYLRPGREAAIMRRLLARHAGRFPAIVIVRIWRELIAATLHLEVPFSVSVFEPGPSVEGLSFLALARSYYGVESIIKPARTEAGVLRAVRDGKAMVGVLPLPTDENPGAPRSDPPWWHTMASGGDQRPHVIARLPWLPTPVDGPKGMTALAIAKVPPEPSGDDIGYLALEVFEPTSREKVRNALTAAGFKITGAASWQDPEDRSTRWHLVAIEGFLDERDPRLGQFAAGLGEPLRRTVTLGCYARPPEPVGLSAGTP